MRLETHHRQWLSWLFVGFLITLCGILGTLQYRWIGAVSRAERTSLQQRLQESLARVGREFDAEILQADAALAPASPDSEAGSDEAYSTRYRQWKQNGRHTKMFRRIAVARPKGEDVALAVLDPGQESFVPAGWPEGWSILRQRLTARVAGQGGGGGRGRGFDPRDPDELLLSEFPHFSRPAGFGEGRIGEGRFGPGRFGGRGEPGPGDPRQMSREADWMIVELDPDYLRNVMTPDLLRWQFGEATRMDYQIEVVRRDSPSTLLYQTDPGAPRIGDNADATTPFFEPARLQFGMRPGPPRDNRTGPPGGPPDAFRGRWLLMARHRAGSLEAVVQQARWRSLAVSAAVLALMIAAIVALMQFTRRAQRLAHLQMEFVAGVSHELRTPLSVIRTAAHNLGGGVVTNAERMRRYGELIEEEAEKLTGIIEQVLRFSSMEAGRPNYVKEMLTAPELIESAVQSSAKALHEANCTVEQKIEPDLPAILGDATALKQVIQNLLINATKYGAQGGWIGVSAALENHGKAPAVAIEVTDHGAGIPPDELSQIFDPFYRGKKAVGDQIHGTGLGLSLVKRIVEAHGGTVGVRSALGKGTQFVLRLPAAPNGTA